jgi:hypothetical protein
LQLEKNPVAPCLQMKISVTVQLNKNILAAAPFPTKKYFSWTPFLTEFF